MEKRENGNYICITNTAKSKEGNHRDIVRNYLKNGNNAAFLKLREEIYGGEDFISAVTDVFKRKTVKFIILIMLSMILLKQERRQ